MHGKRWLLVSVVIVIFSMWGMRGEGQVKHSKKQATGKASKPQALTTATDVTHGLSPKFALHDQPEAHEVFRWNGQVIVRADDFYVLNMNKPAMQPLQLPGNPKILALSTYSLNNPIALCQNKPGRVLLMHTEGQWTEIVTPSHLQDGTGDVLLAADEHSIVIADNANVYSYRGGQWRTFPYANTLKPSFGKTVPEHALIYGSTVFFGYNRGEWGGVLLSLDLDKGVWEAIQYPEESAESPVFDIKMDQHRNVWVIQGMSHLNLRAGEVHVFDGKTWTLSIKESNYQRTPFIGWNLKGTSLDGLAFDASDRSYLLSGSLGILQKNETEWNRFTTWCPDFLYVESLAFVNNTAVIVTYDAGVLLWKPGSTHLTRVAFRLPGK